jgi:hypothetical protein
MSIFSPVIIGILKRYASSERVRSAGVTLVETLIASSLLAVSLAGSLALIAQTTRLVEGTHNELIGAQLAQEGVEIVHNIRMTNWIAGSAWDAGLNDGDYCANYISASLSSCGAYSLNLDGSWRYVHSAGSSSPFSRKISLLHQTDADLINYLRVQSTVWWGSGPQVIAEEHLYDWR